MRYLIVTTRLFRKHFRRVIRQGKNQQKIEEIFDRLALREAMPGHYKIHKLKGEYEGYFELHIEPDLLLVYAYEDELLILDLINIGSHSELFGK